MLLHTAKKNLLPALMAVSGAALLVAALPLAYQLPMDTVQLYAANLIAWILAATLLAVHWVNLSVPVRRIGRYLLAIGVFAWSACPTQNNGGQAHTLTMESLSLAGAALFIAGLIAWEQIHPCLARIGDGLRRTNAIPSELFAWLCYVAFLTLAVWLAWRCFSFFPVYTDSEAQYVHAKSLAGGHLYAPSHPLKQFFYVPMSVNDHGRWYSQYPPLHVMLLALGHLIGTPWMINPAEGALTVLVIYLLARRISGEATARIAALLMLACQFMLFMSAEYMNHATSLLFTALFLLSYVASQEALPNQTLAGRWALAAGLSLGAVFLTRPLTAVGVSITFVFYALYLLRRDPRTYFRPFLIMALGGIACLAFQAWYDWQLTGDPLVMPYVKYGRKLHAVIGFNDTYDIGEGFTKAHEEWRRLNQALFEWPVPCTLFVLLACLLPLKNRWLRLLLALLFFYTAVNMANRYYNFAWGPRYIYETLPALIILTAVGIGRLPLLIKIWGKTWPGTAASRGIAALLVFLIFVPAAAYRLPANIKVYYHYFDNRPNFYYSMLKQSEKPALIFIGQRPNKKNPTSRYRWVTHANPPTEDAPVIFATDQGKEKNVALIQYYPHRHAYLERNGALYPIDETTASEPAQKP